MTIFERIQAVLTFRNGTIVNLDESSIISASGNARRMLEICLSVF